MACFYREQAPDQTHEPTVIHLCCESLLPEEGLPGQSHRSRLLTAHMAEPNMTCSVVEKETISSKWVRKEHRVGFLIH